LQSRNVPQLIPNLENPPLYKNSHSHGIYAESYGCTANKFDFEILVGHLVKAGYHLCSDVDSADVIIVNTCGVKKPTEDRIIERLRALSGTGKPLVVSGCLPKINFKAILKAASNFSAVIDPYSVDKIVLAVKLAEKGEKGRIYYSKKPIAKLEQPKISSNTPIEIISISEGCAGACAFCCVRFARGTIFSYPKKAIVNYLCRAVQRGAKEVWLTSQDTGAYGLDAGSNLAELLRDCCEVDGEFLIRVGMMNPDHVFPILAELIDAYRDNKVYKFLHLPVQSGDDEVLRRMNRKYSVDEFRSLVKEFKSKILELTLSTDVICGFPGETSGAFDRSLQLIEEVQPDIVNISKFFPRPGTPAEKMSQIDVAEVKARSRALAMLVRQVSLERNRRWLGWAGKILVDKKGTDQSWVGRNFAYKPIVVKSGRNLLGKFLNVKVVKAFSTYLEAEAMK
jgi:threonylcarbamoyladenosine tRNA methylthiotransferase CDKAL1